MGDVKEHVTSVLLIAEEEPVDGGEAGQQNFQPTAKVGAKKQKKMEEKQAKKAQREVRGLILSSNSELALSM